MSNEALREALCELASGRGLSSTRTTEAVLEIIDGLAEPPAIAAFLTALHFHGIDSHCLWGALSAVLQRMERLNVPARLRPILDTCGTGGDGVNSVNVSTASAIVVAACGVRVAKHGNKSASGNSGSAEVLSELGVKFDADSTTLVRCLEDVGIAFLFAPRFHPALRHAAPARKALPFRTIFNLLGPLANPARPDAQILGVPDRAKAALLRDTLRERTDREWLSDFEARLIEPTGELSTQTSPDYMAHLSANDCSELASNLRELASNLPGQTFRAFVVTGETGLDEVTLSGVTHVFPTRGHEHEELSWTAADFGLPMATDETLRVTGPRDSADRIRAMLAGEHGPVRNVVLANAAAALKLVEKVDTLAEGVGLAAEAIDSGQAKMLLDRWAAVSHS